MAHIDWNKTVDGKEIAYSNEQIFRCHLANAFASSLSEEQPYERKVGDASVRYIPCPVKDEYTVEITLGGFLVAQYTQRGRYTDNYVVTFANYAVLHDEQMRLAQEIDGLQYESVIRLVAEQIWGQKTGALQTDVFHVRGNDYGIETKDFACLLAEDRLAVVSHDFVSDYEVREKEKGFGGMDAIGSKWAEAQ